METIILPPHKLHFFVCTNDRTSLPENTKPSCGPRIAPEHVRELKNWIRQRGLTGTVYCTQAKCLGFCNSDSSIACLYPSGEFVKYTSVEELKEWILRKVSTF